MKTVTKDEASILVCMVLAILLNGIDVSIVNVALPSIADEFGTGLSEAAWVTICYIVMMGGLLLPFGRIVNAGRIRQVYLAGFAVFTAGSLFCGLSESFGMLLAFRVVQGVGAAMVASTAPLICVKLMPARILGFSLGVMTLACASGYTLGPFIGGIITAVASWHWVFYVNVPVGILAILFGLRVLPSEEREDSRVDWPGSASLFLAVICLMVAIERSTDPCSRSLCIAAAIVTIVSLAAFILIEKRSKDPLIELSIFRNWRLDSVVLAFGLFNVMYIGALYILPFYLQGPMELDSAECGLLMLLPSTIALTLGIPIGKACDRKGKRRYAVLAAEFNIVYCAMFMVMRPELGILPVLVTAVFMGLVWGTCGASGPGRIVDNVPENYRGMGSALMSFVNYTSCAMGTAVFAALMTVGAKAADISLEDLPDSAFMDGMWFSGLCSTIMAVAALICAVIVNEKEAGASGKR